MTLVLPYPNTPTNGQPGDPVPINANFTAITQAIQDFDGSQIAAGSVADSALATNIDPITRGNETVADFVFTGCVWSSVSGLSGTCTGGTYYVNGNRIVFPGVVSHTFTASKDTYVDLDYLGNVTYSAVSNNAASPSITANSIRVAIVITGASSITFVNTGQIDSTLSGFAPVISSVSLTTTDSLGNLIYPTDPQQKVLGYREISGNATATTIAQIPGLTCPVVVPTGRKVNIEVYSSDIFAGASAIVIVSIWDGVVSSGTQIGRALMNNGGTTGITVPLTAKAEQLPSTASKIYNAGLSSSSGTATFEAGTTYRAYIKVTLD
jgi:hypothetical protein